ncbi:hypothetical protein KSP39_PZI017213 [Platanthera zijinensis]|uniref:Thylakoid membrane protein slr0575 n=1 Tax=Platanthera zijinensis TaxID=2320716 RepID=A0AAP0B5Z2_9ASPA
MLIEAAAQLSATTAMVASASCPLRLSVQPAESVLCRQRGLRLEPFHPLQTTECSLARFRPSPLNFPHRHLTVASAADSTPPASAAASSSKTVVSDEGFSLYKLSFGAVGLAFGGTLLSYGFGAYFTVLPGSEWSALMLTYGFPLAIIGMALKYAELKPVPCITYSDAQSLRETYATPILKQVRDDVTRFRYGDEQHLDEALKRIFQYGLGGGISRRSGPILQLIREEVTEDGKYSLVLVFEAKALQLSDFERRQVWLLVLQCSM